MSLRPGDVVNINAGLAVVSFTNHLGGRSQLNPVRLRVKIINHEFINDEHIYHARPFTQCEQLKTEAAITNQGIIIEFTKGAIVS